MVGIRGNLSCHNYILVFSNVKIKNRAYQRAYDLGGYIASKSQIALYSYNIGENNREIRARDLNIRELLS